MNTENIVREYLRNKRTYRIYVEENILRLKKDISAANTDFKLEIADFAFPDNHQISVDSTNSYTDKTAEALLRYEECRMKMYENQMNLLNERLEQLLYLTDLKKLYEHIDIMIIKLEPKQKISVDIYTNGGKVSQIAKELNCSYNTARTTLNNSIRTIAGGIDNNFIRE